MTGAEMSDAEHVAWLADLASDDSEPPAYVSPWYRALAAELEPRD